MQQFKDRVNQLMELAIKVLNTRINGKVNVQLFNEFRSSSLSFIFGLYGENHPHYKEFDKNVTHNLYTHTEKGLGILKAIKKEIDSEVIKQSFNDNSKDNLAISSLPEVLEALEQANYAKYFEEMDKKQDKMDLAEKNLLNSLRNTFLHEKPDSIFMQKAIVLAREVWKK